MSKNIVKAATVVLIMNLLTKILGFVREMAIARGFGATSFTDAYVVAYTIPYFLQSILGFALVTITVPILTKYLVENDTINANKLGSNLINVTAILMTVLTLLGIWGASGVVWVTAPSFDSETAAIATKLTKIMFPSIIFMGVGMVITGILNANYRFAAGAFAPGFSNIVIILSVVMFSSYGITGLAIGTLVSFVGFLLVQIPSLFEMRFKYTPHLNIHDSDIKHALYTVIPIVLGTAVNQIYFAINRIFASGLAEGSITTLNYASKLMNLPVGVFVAAIVAAIYPALSELVIKGDKEQLAKTMDKGMGVVALVALPAAIGLIMLRVPIVQLLFEGGAFNHSDTLVTADALLYFCVGLLPVAAIMVITRAYYAIGDVKMPVYTGMFSIVINVAASFIFIQFMGSSGLALANSVAIIVNMILLLALMKRHLPNWNYRHMFVSFIKICIASVIMAVVVYAVQAYLGSASVKLIVLLGISAGILAYGVAVIFLRVDEVSFCTDIVKKKLGKSK